MAEGVLLSALNDNIVALCIHDSFVVQKRHEGRIREFMDEQFSREVRRLNPDAISSIYVQKVPHMEVLVACSFPASLQLDLFVDPLPVVVPACDFLSWRHGVLPVTVRVGLRHALERQGLRQDDVAIKVGISRPQFANALQGRFGVSAPVANRIKALLLKTARAA